MSKLSVIIPVYNAGDYIGSTIENIHTQTLQDFELLIVDNNSTDNGIAQAREKVAELAMSNVTFLEEETPGPSAARNKGLEAARGEYVCFIDADDVQTPDFFALLVEAMETPLPGENRPCMATCGYEVYRNHRMDFDTLGEEGLFTAEAMAKRLFDTSRYQGFIWDKIFRMDIIRRIGLRFEETVFYNEDRLFVMNYLAAVMEGQAADDRELPAAVILADKPYHYIFHDTSAMADAESLMVQEKTVTEFEAFEKMLGLIDGLCTTDSELFAVAWKDYVNSQLRMFRKMLTNEKREAFRYYRLGLRRYARSSGRWMKKHHLHVDFLAYRIPLLWNKYMQYGKLGLVYTKDPSFFDQKEA